MLLQPESLRTRCWSRVTALASALVCPPTCSPRARLTQLQSSSWSEKDRSPRRETGPSGRNLLRHCHHWCQFSRVIENLSKCFCKIVRAYERNQLRLQNNLKPLKDYFVNIDNFPNKCCIKIALLFWLLNNISPENYTKIFCFFANDLDKSGPVSRDLFRAIYLCLSCTSY